MLFKKERKRRRGVSPFRMILSLAMFLILIVGIYSAYKSFSGMDPLKVSPKSALNSVVSSDRVYNLITGLLSFSPKSLANTVKDNPIIKDNPSHQVYKTGSQTPASTSKLTPKPALAFRFAVVTDSHNDNDDLKKALTQAKDAGAKFVIGTGDWTDVGTIDELRNSKAQFDASGLTYYVVPGDHDLWDSRNRSLPPLTDFEQVYGKDYSSFDYQGDHFLLIDNSDDYDGIDATQMQFIQNDLDNASQNHAKLILAFTHTPLYHPSSDHVMGRVEPKLKNQASSLLSLFKSRGVAGVLSGDTHFFTNYTDPVQNIEMTTVGAITAYRNIQAPRYVMVDVYTDGSYNIQDTEVK